MILSGKGGVVCPFSPRMFPKGRCPLVCVPEEECWGENLRTFPAVPLVSHLCRGGRCALRTQQALSHITGAESLCFRSKKISYHISPARLPCGWVGKTMGSHEEIHLSQDRGPFLRG